MHFQNGAEGSKSPVKKILPIAAKSGHILYIIK
jgi:hypothetical protein